MMDRSSGGLSRPHPGGRSPPHGPVPAPTLKFMLNVIVLRAGRVLEEAEQGAVSGYHLVFECQQMLNQMAREATKWEGLDRPCWVKEKGEQEVRRMRQRREILLLHVSGAM